MTPRKGSGTRFPNLPSAPLVAAIDRATKADETEIRACRRLGISDRAVRDWRSGKKLAQFNTVDKVLLRLGLLWWEVYTPETVPCRETLAMVRYAFTGEREGEQLELAA